MSNSVRDDSRVAAQNSQNSTAFNDFINSLQTESCQEFVAQTGGKIVKTTKKKRAKQISKKKIDQELENSTFGQIFNDLKALETCQVEPFSGGVIRTDFCLKELAGNLYYTVVRNRGWLSQATEELFLLRCGVISKSSKGLLEVELFNKKSTPLNIICGSVLGQIVIRKFEY